MTPREELLGDIDNLVEAYGQSRQETRRTLNKYAIGKWVPVSERLPTKKGFYAIGWDDNYKHPDFTHSWFEPAFFDKVNYWFTVRSSHRITRWLELDIPEVES